MVPKPSRMRLTPELVARVLSVDESLPPPFTAPSDADHDDTVRAILAAAPSADEVWIFAYGSLMWNPACDFVEQRVGFVPGWHRSFCLGWDRWFRGSDRRPALMLSLDRGGRCKGAVYRLPPNAIEANLGRLFRREIRAKPSARSPRWVNVRTDKGALHAITFVINRSSERYVRGLSLEQIADALAVACGPWGSMADYLHSTVSHLEDLGIHDKQLWRLQEL
ncbi:MAG: gamma-glutamylcyclotransferase [Mesorhizobium sp.]|nr:MAG: gamma-glutamylcyclotransferase [Mesorhizobium sp.]